MTEEQIKKLEAEIAPKLVDSVVKSLYAAGHIKESDLLSEKSLFTTLVDIVSNSELEVIIDHRESLLEEAKKKRLEEKFDFSRIFYATFFEHQINDLIAYYCESKGLNKKTQIEIIRSINLKSKFTWLLELLRFPKFNKSHLDTIIKLSEERNSFVHYKFKVQPGGDEVPNLKLELKEREEEFKNIDKAVKYFKNYTTRIKFKGKKGSINKLLLDKKKKVNKAKTSY